MQSLIRTAVISIASVFLGTAAEAQDLKILTIGNSFTWSLGSCFPSVVKSVPGCSLKLDFANHGGCELQRHWSYVEQEENDPACKMYQDKKYKLREILAKEKWDIVTIQQASHASWNESTYQPFARNICDYVKKYAPQAEIVIQQTWAYRSDDPRLMPGSSWKIDQTGMYERLTAAYTKLGEELNCRIIPTGYAVQLARQNQEHPFVNYDPELMKTLRWPDLPPQAGAIVGNCSWKKDEKTGELKLNRDTIHLNARGEYLQACVWFAFLYNRKTSEIKFVPPTISNSDAEYLREMAQKAVDGFKQVRK